MVRELEALSEEERRALRGSKFAPLPSLHPPPSSQPRLAHPGGPLRTNKAAALAKFLERKLQEPNGLASINPDLLEIAVQNAKHTVHSSNYFASCFSTSTSGTSNSGSKIQHVNSFDDSEDSTDGGKVESSELKKYKKKKKKKNKNKKTEKDKNNKKRKIMEEAGCAIVKKSKRKSKS